MLAQKRYVLELEEKLSSKLAALLQKKIIVKSSDSNLSTDPKIMPSTGRGRWGRMWVLVRKTGNRARF